MAVLLFCLLWLVLLPWRRHGRHGSARIRRRPVLDAETLPHSVRSQCKPPWVVREIIRLRAWSPDLGCRTIAELFNRRFAEHDVSVGKTYVATLLKKRRAEVLHMRRTLRHRIPHPMPKNRTWALDLTGKADLSGRQRIVLGLLDHGTRACLRLVAMKEKSSLAILRELIAAFRQHGIPRMLRTDNEACFVSRTIRAALALLGIRHQRIDLHCPWQNGRIERFFGTLKEKLDRIAIADHDDLHSKLIAFRFWYNHVRPHQHLHGRTPAEAWAGRKKSTRRPEWFDAWEGRLTGWFFPP